MKTVELHHLIGLFFTHEEAAAIIGVKRQSYTRAICTRDATYTSYMTVMKRHTLKTIANKPHLKHIRRQLELTSITS